MTSNLKKFLDGCIAGFYLSMPLFLSYIYGSINNTYVFSLPLFLVGWMLLGLLTWTFSVKFARLYEKIKYYQENTK